MTHGIPTVSLFCSHFRFYLCDTQLTRSAQCCHQTAVQSLRHFTSSQFLLTFDEMSSFVLLTGMPGCGKTTMIQQIVGEMKKGSRVPKIQGFYTQESRDARNERIGFDVVMMNGTRGILARAG